MYITPRDTSSTLSQPELQFIRSAARGISSSRSSLLRLDGRQPSEPRPIRLSFSRCHNRSECVIQFASHTRAAASVYAELVPPPNADRPNDGQVKFTVEVGPMGCMGYEVVDRPVSNYSEQGVGGGGGGGSGDVPYVQRLKSNSILRILERTLLIGGAMDAEALCVQSGTWVWRLCVDVSLLDDGGNALDACVLAAVSALRHYRLPEVNIGGEVDDDLTTAGGNANNGYQETTIIHSDDREPTPLPLHHTPLTATFALFADETGTTTAVSALLDPCDREELACDGLLTWSYNKYGEMCCLDFPGGCELRPRQLMASAKLGKKRCIEICELLETALEAAEKKAESERMERLKMAENNAPSQGLEMTDVSAIDDEAEADEEDEAYRQKALDYSSGHFAASVKEDSDKKPRKERKETSSLFNAILRSAQSAPGEDENAPPIDGATTVTNAEAKKADVEIVACSKNGQKVAIKSTNPKSDQPTDFADSGDEEETVQLTSEFAEDSTKPTQSEPEQVPDDSTTSIAIDINEQDSQPILAMEQPRQGEDINTSSVRKKSRTAPKPKGEEDDVTDLSQALKKKKKKKKSKK